MDDDDDLEGDNACLTNDDNLCGVCAGAKDEDFVDWIGCDRCFKWYHVECLEDENLEGKSMNEIKKMTYYCGLCKC